MAAVKKKKTFPKIIKQSKMQDRWKNGHLAIVTEPDEDNLKRTVTRIRVKSSYDEMFNRGTITKEQRDCAERYAILCEKADGATQDLYAKVSLLSESRKRWEHTQSQHDAYEKLFKIWEGMGRYNIMILNMVVLGDLNASQISKAIGYNRHAIMGMIKPVFDMLEHLFIKYEKSSCTV